MQCASFTPMGVGRPLEPTLKRWISCVAAGAKSCTQLRAAHSTESKLLGTVYLMHHCLDGEQQSHS